jgi:hypothetical protein
LCFPEKRPKRRRERKKERVGKEEGTYFIFSCRRPTAKLAKLVLSHTTDKPSSLPPTHLKSYIKTVTDYAFTTRITSGGLPNPDPDPGFTETKLKPDPDPGP